MQTEINLNTLKAVALAASTEKTCYYLNGVLIECREGSVTYVATSGHILLAAWEDFAEDDKNDDEPRLIGDYIVPLEVIKSLKIAKHGPNTDTLVKQGDALMLQSAGRVFQPIDGTFPDWRRVLLDSESKDSNGKDAHQTPAQFNWDYMATMQKFGALMNVGKPQIVYGNPDLPHPVVFGGTTECFGMIVALRGTARDWSIPSWVNLMPVTEPVGEAAA